MPLRDNLMQSLFFRNFYDLENEKPVKLKGSDVKIWASFTDPSFDNDDNEYATIRMHYYSDESTLDGSYEEDVPMVPC